jgi:protein-disulfide isomerase
MNQADSSITNEQAAALKLRKDDHWLGERKAALIVAQYGAYHSAASNAVWQVLREEIKWQPDALCVIYRHSPLSTGVAAEAAECAAVQGYFWEMHELLGRHADALDEGSLVEYATQLKLDVTKFLRDLSRRRCRTRVDRDLASGRLLGISTVPALFVAGKALTDAQIENLGKTLRLQIQEATL